MKKHLLAITLAVWVVLGACGGKQAVAIDIPDDTKEAIENAAPKEEYVFYALKTSAPETAEDLKGRDLVMCCGPGPGFVDVILVSASDGYLGGSGHIQKYVGVGGVGESHIRECMDYVRDNPQCILVMERDVQFEESEELVEVVFK